MWLTLLLNIVRNVVLQYPEVGAYRVASFSTCQLQMMSSTRDGISPNGFVLVWQVLAINVPYSHSDKVSAGSVPGIISVYIVHVS